MNKWTARCILENGPALDFPVKEEEKHAIITCAKNRTTYELFGEKEFIIIDFKHLLCFSISENAQDSSTPTQESPCDGK